MPQNKGDQPHLGLLDRVPFQPVFIMGDHRSGTTLLYQLLAQTGCFNVVTAYHVIHYDELLSNHLSAETVAAKLRLSQRFQDLGLTNRIIDGVAVTPDLPEEYGFIMDPSNRPMMTPRNLPRAREIFRKIQFISEPGRPLLLKNPWDILRFRFVKESFPNARFIFIHRHPAAVMNSQLQTFRSVLAARNDYIALIAPWYRKLFEQPLRLATARLLFSRSGFWKTSIPPHICKVADYDLANIGSIPKQDYFSSTYEKLCQDPDTVIGRMLEFCGVTPASPISYRSLIEPRAPKILPEVEASFRKIRDRLQPYLRYHGYVSDSPPAVRP